jgi:RNA polymerase sigma factor (sigma-70 family)
MAIARSSDLLRQVRTLFGLGTGAGLTDAQLLERFTAQSASGAEAIAAAEAAFEVLLARHGPMVLGVCRRALADPGDIEDAFQATFLVLVRRAGSVQVGDSLGRWLYGVARRVAGKARARSERLRSRSAPHAGELAAPDADEDRTQVLVALDEEVSRLPEKYRIPVILCHLEGLTHAEAAARLRWPVGTVSGRLSRARGLLKDRLVRRGMTPTAGFCGSLLALETARAAVREPLIAATAQAATALAAGGGVQGGAASASALALMNEVLRAAVAFRLKATATVLLIFAVAGAGVAAVGAGFGAGTRNHSDERVSRPEPTIASKPVPIRPADEIIKEIEAMLKTARRLVRQEEFDRNHAKIASLVDELRTAYPDDPCVAKFLPKRWASLSYINRKAEASAEVGAVLRTTNDPVLTTDALFFQGCLRFLEPIDGLAAVALAEAFATQAPRDNRAAELFYQAAQKLDEGWFTRVGLAVAFALAGVITIAAARKRRAGTRRLRKLAARSVKPAFMMLVALLCSFVFLLSSDRQTAIIGFLLDVPTKIRSSVMIQRSIFILFALSNELLRNLQAVARSGRAGLAVVLAAATATVLIVASRHNFGRLMARTSTVRLAILGSVVGLSLFCAVDACLIARQGNAVRERIHRDFPDSFRGRLVQGEQRQHARIGEPFELEFVDAISGRPVSMKSLRGRIVVVDFWATWCGPCVGEIPELKRLYALYHDKGVEFIGVSQDLPEEDGGLSALKEFVQTWQIPWPQCYQGHDNQLIETGTPTNDFSEFWGISGIPTVFLIDAEGKLYSTTARGRLDTLIPRLLEKSSTVIPKEPHS